MEGVVSRMLGSTLVPLALPVMRRCWPSDRYLWPLSLMNGRMRKGADRDVSLRTADGVTMLLRTGEYPDCAMHHGVFELRTVKLLRTLLQQRRRHPMILNRAKRLLNPANHSGRHPPPAPDDPWPRALSHRGAAHARSDALTPP